jgi:hypothetical protein
MGHRVTPEVPAQRHDFGNFGVDGSFGVLQYTKTSVIMATSRNLVRYVKYGGRSARSGHRKLTGIGLPPVAGARFAWVADHWYDLDVLKRR